MNIKLVNATSGKIGTYVSGPKQFLNESIQLGEAAVCIARDPAKPTKPFVWVIGPIDVLIDYISIARHEGELEESDASLILSRLDEAKKTKPKTAIARLAHVLNLSESELVDLLQLAQANVSNQIMGTKDLTSGTPKVSFGTKIAPNSASTNAPN